MIEVIGPNTPFAEQASALGLPPPLAKAVQYYLDLEKRLFQSKTAMGIMGLLEKSDHNYYVLVCESTAMYLDHDHLKSAIGFNGGIAVIWPNDEIQLGAGKKTYGEISLIHELGHALQWQQNPLWYRGHTRRSTPELKGGGATLATSPKDTKDSKYVVETHNVFNHEWPVCDELGIEKRPDYCGAKIDDYKSYWPA